MSTAATIAHILIALVLAPLQLGVINRTKAAVAGRHGQPFLQPYHDLLKLFGKGAVYSRTGTWILRFGPILAVAAPVVALGLVPLGAVAAPAHFPGDIIALIYLLGLARFMTVLAAWDSGSAFTAMGASREVQFAVLAEVAQVLALAVLATCTGQIELTAIYRDLLTAGGPRTTPVALLAAATLLAALLTENARIPVDDPNTHLELTMVHEAMVLDHGGVDLGLILYGSALRLWISAALFAGVLLPVRPDSPILQLALGVAAVFVTAVAVGIIESSMARLRLLRVPQMLVAAIGLTVIAIIWVLK